MYQLLIRLRATRDCAWERQYNRKLRGRLAQAIEGGVGDEYRDSSQSPFTFSDLMPADTAPGQSLEAGDDVHLLVAGDLPVLRGIAEDLKRDPEVTAGAFVFEARAATPLETGVGPVDSTGTVTTASGTVITVDPDSEEMWSDRDHSEFQFVQALGGTVRRIVDNETDVPVPEDPTGVFDDYRHRKTYVTDVRVTPEYELTVIASKWDFDYTVRDESHREVLNALLRTGVGWKRSYGFGCLQTKTDAARIEDGDVAGGQADATGSEVA